MSTADETRYGKPPRCTKFRKRQSGNPAGRPPGRKKEPPYEAVLGQMVTVREDGIERRLTAAEAFLLYLTKQGLDGDSSAARYLSPMIEGARVRRREFLAQDPRKIVLVIIRPGSVNTALGPLRMARKLDRYRRTARMTLEPWVVERALDRLGDRRLTLQEQQTVLKATRTPTKVRWPDWWEALPEAGHSRPASTRAKPPRNKSAR